MGDLKPNFTLQVDSVSQGSGPLALPNTLEIPFDPSLSLPFFSQEDIRVLDELFKLLNQINEREKLC